MNFEIIGFCLIVNCACLFVCFRASQHFFIDGDGFSWVETVLKKRINVSCSRTQRSDVGEARIRNLSVSSQVVILKSVWFTMT